MEWESWLEKEDKEKKKKPTMFPRIRREFDDEKDEEPMVYNKNAAWEDWLEKDAMDGKQGGSPKDEEPKRDYLKEFHDEIKRIKAAGKNDPKRLAYLKDQKKNKKRIQQHLDSNNLINNYSKRLRTNSKKLRSGEEQLDDLGDETNVELGNVKDYTMGNEGYHKKSWEVWLEKGRWDKPKHDTNTQKEFEAFEKLSKLPKNEVTELGDSIDEAIEGVKRGKLKKNNAIETSHKDGEKKVEWDGKFSSSTIEDEVKNEDEKSESEEESLEELTDGDLVEIEKLKSWELWLEKDALDGKGGNEAKGDLRQPSLFGMWTKPTRQTKEGQARDYIPDTPSADSHFRRRLGHGEKYESGRRPLEKKPQSGGYINEKREEEWDITADQDAQQRGSGKNTFDDKDDVEPSGGFIQGQGRTIPKTGKSPKIKPQGKGVKHRGRPRGSKNKAWELWLEKGEYDEEYFGKPPPEEEQFHKDWGMNDEEFNLTYESNDEKKKLPNPKVRPPFHKTGDTSPLKSGEYSTEFGEKNKNWELWLEKNERWDKDEKKHDKKHIKHGKSKKDAIADIKAIHRHMSEERQRDDRVEDEEIIGDVKNPILAETQDKPRPTPSITYPNLTPKKPKYVKGVEQIANNVADERDHLNIQIADSMKSWESWLKKMQGAGDARFGNQHLTGLDQKPVNNEEDEANILPEKEEKTDDKEEKQEKTDNKPYKALGGE